MESRNISLTLEKAREWYNSGSADLREIALQAYTEEELKTPKFTDIKSFEDAYKALGMSTPYVKVAPFVGNPIADHLYAICKINIIQKALNKDWKPSLVEGKVYYPYVRLYPAYKAREAADMNGYSLGPSFYAEGKKYTLVGGDCYCSHYAGMADLGYGPGVVLPAMGLLSCKSKEIAEHMSRYFSKEIFEATYASHAGTYEWV